MRIRTLFAMLVLVSFIALPAITAYADDEINIFVDGTLLQFDVPPQIIDGRTMVPMRAIFEALGAEIEWHQETQSIFAAADEIALMMTVGSERVHTGDGYFDMDVPPLIIDGRTLVPARFVAQAMGLHVGWVSTNSTVYIGNTTTNFANSRHLELVNHNHPIADAIDPALLVSAWPTVSVRARDIMLHESTLAAVSAMFDAATQDEIDHIFVSSGYRDFAMQAELYDNAEEDGFVMPPGHSEHHTGFAVDILIRDIAMHHIPDFPQGRWMAANAWRFGLIQRYPADMEHITGINFEPWHYRYVGQIHAWYMRENDMVLEQYIEHIRQTGGFSTELNGRIYTVLHQIATENGLHIPFADNFVVSSDNLGGYIITMWQ